MYWIIFLIIIIVLCILYFCIAKVGSGVVDDRFSDKKYKKQLGWNFSNIITNTDTDITIHSKFNSDNEETVAKELDFASTILNNENTNIKQILDLLKINKIETKLEIKSLNNIPFLYITLITKVLNNICIKYSSVNSYIIYWILEEQQVLERILEPVDIEIIKNKIKDLAFIIKMPEIDIFIRFLRININKIDPSCEISFLKYYIPAAVYIETDTIYKKLLTKYDIYSLSRLYERSKITIYYETEYCNIPLYIYKISNIGIIGELRDYKVDYKIVNNELVSTPREVISYMILDIFINDVNSLFNCIISLSKNPMVIINQHNNTILCGSGRSNDGIFSFQFDLGDPNNYILNINGRIQNRIIFTDIRTLREQLVARHPLIFQRPNRLMG